MDAGRKKVSPPVARAALDVVRRNVVALRTHAGETPLKEIAEKSGVGYGTLHRLVTDTPGPSGNTPPPNLDTLAALASYFGLAVWQLLVPKLDPARPPQIQAPPDDDIRLSRSDPARSRHSARRITVDADK